MPRTMRESIGKWVTKILKNRRGAVTIFSQQDAEHQACTASSPVIQGDKQTTFLLFFPHVVQEIKLDWQNLFHK